MAEDQVKQDANSTPLDGLSSLAKAALAIGTSSALFYRAGGDIMVSEELNRAYRFRNALMLDINKTGGLQATLPEWKQRGLRWRDLWNDTASQSTEDYKFNERTSTIFDLLRKRYEFDQTDYIRREVGAELYHDDILGPIFSSKEFKELPTDLKDQLHDYLERAYGFRNQPARLQELRDKMSGELLKHKELADKFLEEMQNRIHEVPFSKSDIGYEHATDELWSDSQLNKERVDEEIANRRKLLDAPEIYLEELQHGLKKKKAIRFATGDRAMTLRDMIENPDIRNLFIENKLVTDKDNNPINAIDYLEETVNSWKEQYKDNPEKLSIINQILDSEFSQEFRVEETIDKNGKKILKPHSFRTINNGVDALFGEYRNTLFGHLFKASEMVNVSRQPKVFLWHKGDFVPGLELAVSGNDEERLSTNVLKVGNRYYKQNVTIGEGGRVHTSWEYLEDSPFLRTHSNETGAFKRTILAMYDKDGRNIVMDQSQAGFFHNILDLDLNIHAPLTLSDEQSEALGNNIAYFQHVDRDIANKLANGETLDKPLLYDQIGRLNRFQNFIDRNTKSMDQSTIRELRGIIREAQRNGELSNDIYRNLLDITQLHDTDTIVERLSVNLGINPDKFLSADLRNDLTSYHRDPRYFMTQYMRQHKDLSSMDVSDKVRETDLVGRIFKRDIQQEMFMRIFSDYSAKNGTENTYRYTRQLLERLRTHEGISDEAIVESRRLMMQAYISWSTGLNRNTIRETYDTNMQHVVENA